MVWEKKKYFLFGIKCAIGTSLIPKSTLHSSILGATSIPRSLYSLSVNTLIGEGSTIIRASTYLSSYFLQAQGERTARLSGGIFRSLMIPNLIKLYIYNLLSTDSCKYNNWELGKQFFLEYFLMYLCAALGIEGNTPPLCTVALV